MLDLTKPWKDYEFVAFDTETSGAYPLGSEIVEFGAVKWKNGREIDRYQTLLKPSQPMSAFIIGIHGITNEMVADAPLMKTKAQEIRNFFGEAFLMAHHAPFDLGFVSVDFEANKIQFPTNPVICTSLLARKMIPESVNHKLQTLIKLLNIPGGQAHRASDDANACLQLGIECMRRMGDQATLKDVLQTVGKDLRWIHYSIDSSGDNKVKDLARAIREKKPVDFVYVGGAAKEATRRMSPFGIVRNPDGDYVMALCHRDNTNKRFYLSKILDMSVS